MSMTKIRVLYVDDEPDLLDLGKIFLEKGNEFDVDTIESGVRALSVLATEKYDAVVSDYQMPEMDGIALLKKVRSQFGTIPFILFTAGPGRGRGRSPQQRGGFLSPERRRSNSTIHRTGA